MKKRTIGTIILSMMLASTGTVFAADGVGEGGSDSADVTGTYAEGTSSIPVYSVDIAWEGLSFTYNGGNEGTWNPDTHQYDGSTEPGWADDEGIITITNHSNVAVTALSTYEAEAGFESADMKFSNPSLMIGSADNGADGEAGNPVTEEITVTPTGTLPEGTDGEVIGHITVTIE